MKLAYCLNLVFSFTVIIWPTFTTLETLILGKKETNSLEEDLGRSQVVGEASADLNTTVEERNTS